MTTKREFARQAQQHATLIQLGFSDTEAEQLRRISMRLHRWHELECGSDNGAIYRDDNGKVYWQSSWGGKPQPYRDLETGALRRLEAIMSRHPTLGHYVQGDPRGIALYILRPGDIPNGESVDSYYSRGIPVY